MQFWQQEFLIAYITINLFLLRRGFWESYKKRNANGLTPYLLPFGMFAWGDTVVLGIFWVGAASAALALHDWALFLLVYSIFWTVRSFGETIYWFNQQFSTVVRMNPRGTWMYSIFHNNYSVWFVLQVVHQCITIISIISSLYLGKLWLGK